MLAALGVNNICSALPSEKVDEHWSVEGLTKLRERVGSFGIHLDMVPLPLSSHEISTGENANILLGKSPERDREIDGICQMIRNAARAGIPALKYNMSILGVVRSEPTRGRGGASYGTFSYAKAKQDTLTAAGRVSGGRLRRHADARPRAEDRGRHGRRPGLRVHLRLHQGADSSGRRGGMRVRAGPRREV